MDLYTGWFDASDVGSSVGSNDGWFVGIILGIGVGCLVDFTLTVGEKVDRLVWLCDGVNVGIVDFNGTWDGVHDVIYVGSEVGSNEIVGSDLGSNGFFEGKLVGICDGCCVLFATDGKEVGPKVGNFDGLNEEVGAEVGLTVVGFGIVIGTIKFYYW